MNGGAPSTPRAEILNGDQSVRSAARALVVLKYLARRSEPATAKEIMEDCLIPKSSLYQVLNVMREHRFVTYYRALRAWGLGLAAFEVGTAALSERQLERLGEPILATLASNTDEAAHLAVRRGNEVEVLVTSNAPQAQSIRLGSQIGVRLPSHLTAAGRAVLMHLSEDELEITFRAERQLPASRAVRDELDFPALVDLLARSRRAGYAIEDQLATPGISSIAAPVFDYSGYAIAGVGVSFLSGAHGREGRRRIVEAVCDAGSRLSARLGWESAEVSA